MRLGMGLVLCGAFALVGCGVGADDVDAFDADDGDVAENVAPLEERTSAVDTERRSPVVTTLPFAQNTTYEVRHIGTNGRAITIGYVFASPSHIIGVVQEQRWILYNGPALPEGIVEFVLPRVNYLSLDAWLEAVPLLWRANATYVKGLTTQTITGGIPVCAASSVFHCGQQLVDEIACVIGSSSSRFNEPIAIVFGGPFTSNGVTHDPNNTEYWEIGPGYNPNLSETTSLTFKVTPANPLAMQTLCRPAGFTRYTTTCLYSIGSLPLTL